MRNRIQTLLAVRAGNLFDFSTALHHMHRQRDAELDNARVLIIGHILLGPGNSLSLRDDCSLLKDDQGLDLFALAL
nr:hypothetical protein [Ktedonobacter racemifer]